jgi:hypothetical protein
MGYFNNFNTLDYDLNGDGVIDVIVDLTSMVKLSDTLINNTQLYEYVTVLEGERPDQLSQRLYGTTQYYWTFMLININIKNMWDNWPKGANQLKEYVEHKYEGMCAITMDDISSKDFIVGEDILGQVSGAVGVLKEIHINKKYIVFDMKAGNFLSSESVIGSESSENFLATLIKSHAYAPYIYLDSSTGTPTNPRTTGTYLFSFFDLETMMNLNNSKLKIIKSDHIAEIAKEFKKEIGS